jgi:ubiquitin related modifier 1
MCSGGMELLFGNEKEITTEVPLNGSAELTVGQAMAWARDNLLTDRPEMFMKGETM